MLRRAVILTASALLTVLVAAIRARASTVLTLGQATTATITVPGSASYTFTGTAGQHIGFDVSASNWGGSTAYLRLYRPAGSQFSNLAMSTGATFGSYALDATGTWVVSIIPAGAATGSATFTLASTSTAAP
jgi:hypothetical protein